MLWVFPIKNGAPVRLETIPDVEGKVDPIRYVEPKYLSVLTDSAALFHSIVVGAELIVAMKPAPFAYAVLVERRLINHGFQ